MMCISLFTTVNKSVIAYNQYLHISLHKLKNVGKLKYYNDAT